MVENKRKIGKIRTAHGLKGELFLHIFSDELDWFEDVNEVFLESKTQDGHFVEYKVENFRPHKDGLLVFLEGVSDRNQSEALQGSMVWVDATIFETEKDDENYFLTEIENFTVYNGIQEIGQISGFTFNGDHDLILVKSGDTDFEYTIPLVEAFIDKIDFENKKVMMNLPEGLLEVQKE